MSWIATILSFITALPKLIEQLRGLYWSWENSRLLRREKDMVKDNDKIHDEIADGGRPKWDDRK